MASSLSYQNFGMDNAGCFQQCFGFGDEHASPIPVPSQNAQDDVLPTEMKSTEAFLASEMSKLSVQERSKALDELHCVGEELQETPELIRHSLEEFDRALTAKNAAIYNLAAIQNRLYVEDPGFRLRFLRANDHDVNKSINQMIGFLSCKEKYFGRDKIARDIRLDDLTPEDMEVMLSGLYHIQDGTDQNGRMVVYLLKHVAKRYPPKSVIRVNYIIMFNILSRMPSVQTKGFVLCTYDFSTRSQPKSLPPLNAVLEFMDFVTKIPVRRSALHWCLKTDPWDLRTKNMILETILRSFERRTRTRVRLHYGSDIELQYKLKSYGFRLDTFPVDAAGNLRKDIINVWLNRYIAERNENFASANNVTLSTPPELVGESAVVSVPELMSMPDLLDAKEIMDVGIDHTTGNWDMMNVFDSSDCVEPETPNSARSNTGSPNTITSLIEPTPNDVLLGRGRGSQLHPGNIRFREFLKDYQDEYNNSQRYKRHNTPAELSRILLGNGMRFLKKTESGGWVESDFAEVEKKVKQVFRTRKKMMAKKTEGV